MKKYPFYFTSKAEKTKARKFYRKWKKGTVEHFFEEEGNHMILFFKDRKSIPGIIDIDASQFPDRLWLSLDSENALFDFHTASVSVSVIRKGKEINFDFDCTFNDDLGMHINLNPIKIILSANDNSKKYGLKSDGLNSSFTTCFSGSYIYVVKNPKGNLLEYFNEGLKRARQLLEDTYSNIRAEVLAEQ